MDSPIVLIVEDEGLIATMLRQVLLARGYQVLIARSGTDALALVRLHQRRIDLLLCDVVLPDAAGHDVARSVGQFCPRMRTLFTSGYPLDDLVERGLLTPEILQDENAFIRKPFRTGELLGLVDSLVSRQWEAATAGMEKEGAADAGAPH